MRDNRNKWQFYEHPSKRALTESEIRFWKGSLPKILKLGVEFEFNLAEQSGSCKGNSVFCACVNMDKVCWRKCLKENECKTAPCYDTCSNRTGKCTQSKCTKGTGCKKYEFVCIGVQCADFVSTCFECKNFKRNCDACRDKYDPNKDPKQIRNNLTQLFSPTGSYGIVNETGVVEVKQDGSLAGDKGVEIITVGRRLDYWEFYNMSKKIIDESVARGAYLNERTGSHMHILSSYYASGQHISEMEKPMPQIILANFHQLVRRYQNALTWMTIALPDPNHMTRWEKFRVSVLNLSPVMKDMQQVISEVSHHAGGNKYGFVNYNNIRFSNNGDDITQFHVEMREADSAMCPSYYAAIACLHYALVIKAVEISKYGLLKVGDEEWLDQAKRMKEVILNGKGDWSSNRVSDTKHLLDHKEYFINESKDLVSHLKGILTKIGPAFDVLSELADRPMAIRLMEGDGWEKIEDDISVKLDPVDHLTLKINEIIDLTLIDDCRTRKEWVDQVVMCLNEDDEVIDEAKSEDVDRYLDDRMREGEIIWSDKVGCVIRI